MKGRKTETIQLIKMFKEISRWEGRMLQINEKLIRNCG